MSRHLPDGSGGFKGTTVVVVEVGPISTVVISGLSVISSREEYGCEEDVEATTVAEG